MFKSFKTFKKYNIYTHIFKKYLKYIALYFISINLITFLSFFLISCDYAKYVDRQLTHNIQTYKVIDKQDLCLIADCTRVYSKETEQCWVLNEYNQLEEIQHQQHNFIKLTDTLGISFKHLSLGIYNKRSNFYFTLEISTLYKEYINIMSIFVPLSMLLFIYPLYQSIKEEQTEMLMVLSSNEALLANKTMINITENIHHELNTPLEVIDNKIEKIHRIITHYLEYDGKRVLDKKSDEIEDDFKFIRTSSEQIYNVLEKMRSFKHLRYSNGNKSIKNVIDEGLKIIAMSNNNFTYKVDEKLNKYTLLGNLKNADLLSIILNHLKNSLEADASQIVLMFVSCHKNVLTFRIIDNGKGIPADVLDTIFDANVSTKSGIRGNGLYLNKHILNAQGGDVEVVQTSKHGTTIEISIMCKDKD